jgi:hypothetical protein
VFGVANPLDKVFEVAVTGALIEDGFDFVFFVVINGYGRRRGRSRGDAIRDGGRGIVCSEETNMEDGVNVQ